MSVGLLLLISLEMLVVSCDEVKNRDVLTFFFDGVEPAKPEAFETRPYDPNEELGKLAEMPLWYVHEPRRECTLCHGKRGRKRTTLQAFLVAPVPQLCYDCHPDYTTSVSFVHGPVAVGQCLFCHNPHKSRVKYLLKQAVPNLCYLCHDAEAVASMPAHMIEELSRCSDCHDAHSSWERSLLKDDALRLGALPDAGKPKEEKWTAIPDKDDLELRKKMRENADLFYLSMDFYREGKLAKAREGFVRVLKSGLIPAPMGKTIRGYLLDIDKRLSEQVTPPEKEK